MPELTHFNQSNEVAMVDVGDKPITQRIAIAEGYIQMQKATMDLLINGQHKKGNVLGIARIAGIMASKKTADLIPLCHVLPITHIEIKLTPDTHKQRIYCKTTVKVNGQTGVEIEALNATQVALLTIYDMCKAVDRGMIIQSVRLIKKQGGKSESWSASV